MVADVSGKEPKEIYSLSSTSTIALSPSFNLVATGYVCRRKKRNEKEKREKEEKRWKKENIINWFFRVGKPLQSSSFGQSPQWKPSFTLIIILSCVSLLMSN